MIHGLASQLKGDLKLTSELGKGTRAELWVPAATSEITNKSAVVEATIDPTVSASGPKRILLVDDDVLIAMSSADMLMDLGHDVVEAHSGKEALEQLGDGSGFDLLITDYSMPGMTGADLTVAVRHVVPKLPILIASGYAELPPGVELDVARLGKPYTQEQLARELDRLFADRI
jgi:CheY-like chemotaxis protein